MRGPSRRPNDAYLSGWRLRLVSRLARLPLVGAWLRVASARRVLRPLRAPPPPPVAKPAPARPGPSAAGPRPPGGPAPLGVSAITAAYRSGRRTPMEVAERALAAASAMDEGPLPLRAFVHVDRDAVRTQAEASFARWRAGRPLGPLDGVPVAIKDEYDVAGQPTACGTAFLGREPARADAVAVARLRAAGAILLGKTNMYELGMGPSGFNLRFGAARNPHDPRRDPGGSSSGAAVAVAAGVAPIAIGTDSGGSLRVPGALSGVAALKGTFGRVPSAGVRAPFSSVLSCGPLGASVADVVTAFASLSGDAALSLAPLPPELRIGIPKRAWDAARSDVHAVTGAALEHVLRAGARPCAVELPRWELALALGFAVLGGEAALALAPHLAGDPPFSPAVRLALELARGITPAQRAEVTEARARLGRDLDDALMRADVLVMPTTAVTAPRYRADALGSGAVDEGLARALTGATLPANLSGLPAAQVPCGYDADGLPVGLQIVGRRHEENLVLSVAAEVERHIAWRRPGVWFDLLD